MTSRLLPPRRLGLATLAVLALVVGPAATLSACSSGSGGSTSDTASSVSADRAGVAADAPAAGRAAPVAQQAGVPDQSLAPRKEISQGEVSLRAADVAAARSDVRRVAQRYDGEVTSDRTESDDAGHAVSAHLVLRIPSGHFDRAMQALRGVGELTWAQADTKDVTTQVIDTRARLHAQRRSVHRVETLLGRAENLRDIVLIESELSRRQAALDSLEQRSAYLADQTSRSTITVEVDHLHRPVAGHHEDRTGFLAGLSGGWHGLTTVAVVIATVLGAVLPFAVVLLVLGLIALPLLRVVRRRRHVPPASAA